jgi:hypothetical protein
VRVSETTAPDLICEIIICNSFALSITEEIFFSANANLVHQKWYCISFALITSTYLFFTLLYEKFCDTWQLVTIHVIIQTINNQVLGHVIQSPLYSATLLDTQILSTVLEIAIMAGMTGEQGMLTPAWHLLQPLMFPRVCASLIFTVDYSII